MGKLIKMKIIAFSDGKYSNKVTDYTVMLNPESIKWDRTIEYNKSQAPDNGQPSVKYKKSLGQNLSFDLVLDCTGVVDSSRLNMQSEISKLKKAVYAYQGNIHRPNFVRIHWGANFTFQGVLTNFDIDYKYFKPSGDALRAKISLKFIYYTDLATVAKEEDKQSPDVTHLIDVIAGDTLPQLSQRIYNSSDYCVQLAQCNGLDKFRRLQPGSRLMCPPLDTGA